MKKRGLLLGALAAALLLALPLSLSAAITYDNDLSEWSGGLSGGSMSNNESVPTGTNQILIVVVSYTASLGSMTVSWNGTSMTLYTTFNGTSGGTTMYNYVYYMVNPPDGSYAIRVQGTFSVQPAVVDFSFSGVSTSSPFGAGYGSAITTGESENVDYNPTYSTSAEVVFSNMNAGSSGDCTASSYSDTQGTALTHQGSDYVGPNGSGTGHIDEWFGLSDRNPVNTSNSTYDTPAWSCSSTNAMLAWAVELEAGSANTPTRTSTSTISPTPSRTSTNLPTGTATQSRTYTRTPSATVSPTITLTPTLPVPIPTNTPTPTSTNTPYPTVYSGLPQNMRPYGLEYVPFPTVVSSSNVFYPLAVTFSTTTSTDISGTATTVSFTNTTGNSDWGSPENTARWHIVFQNLSNTVGSNVTTTAFEVAVETRIGAYGVFCNTGVYDQYSYSTATALSLPSRPQNYSPAYFWVGVSYTAVPYTERFDAAGDPRFEPYADELDYTGGSGASAPIDDGLQGGYNWFWRNFGDTSSTYVDGMQDAFYKPFIPSATTDHYGSNEENIDVPKLYRLIREGVMKSNGIYTAMTGYDSYYSGQGGEIGGDTSNDFQAGVPCYGGPWGSTSDTYAVDEIIGGASINGAVYVVSGTASTINWMSMPFLGELWPDSLYTAQWEGWSSANNGGNPTWGNLKNIEQGGSSYRVMQQDLPTSASPYFEQTLHRDEGEGCATFQNGTNDGTDPFNHNENQENTAPLDNDGTEMSTQYNFSLPSTFQVNREWSLTVGGNTPPEWNMDTSDPEYDYPGRRTHMDTYSATTYTTNANWGFYADSNNLTSGVDKSAAAIRTVDLNDAFSPTASGNPAGGWFIVNGLEPSTQSGINFVAQFAILACLRTFADAGVPTSSDAAASPSFTNNHNTYTGAGAADGSTYRIPPIPLVTILHPTNSDPVAGLSTITIKWDERYARWDGNQYDENYPCLDANVGPCSSSDVVPDPSLEWHDTQAVAFNVIYNMPSGVSSTAWYSALTGAIVPAGPANNYEEGYAGNYMDGADAILPGSSYQTSPYQYSLAWTNVAPAKYALEVECFRLQSETSTECYPHYAYHEILIDTVP